MAHTTKKQREIIRLSKSLPKVTIEDAKDEFLDDMDMSIIDWYCYNAPYQNRYAADDFRLFRIITTHEGYVVDRYFNVTCHKRSLNSFPTYKLSEVAQRWHNDKDDVVLKKVNKSDIHDYFVFWNMRTRLSVRDNKDLPTSIEYTDIDVNSIEEFVKYDKCWSEIYRLTKFDKDKTMKIIFSDTINEVNAEYLLKTRQKRLFNYYISYNTYKVNEYIGCIKLAHRHGYRIRNIRTWFNYLDKVSRIDRKYLSSIPHICPTDIRLAIKKADAKLKKIEIEQERQRLIAKLQKAQEQAMQYAENMKKYLDITFSSSDGSIIFKVLQNPIEFVNEGKKMHNCIGGYYTKYESLCMVALDAKTGKHLANVEISLKDFHIVQCYAPCNKISKHDKKLRLTINANMHLIRNAA